MTVAERQQLHELATEMNIRRTTLGRKYRCLYFCKGDNFESVHVTTLRATQRVTVALRQLTVPYTEVEPNELEVLAAAAATRQPSGRKRGTPPISATHTAPVSGPPIAIQPDQAATQPYNLRRRPHN